MSQLVKSQQLQTLRDIALTISELSEQVKPAYLPAEYSSALKRLRDVSADLLIPPPPTTKKKRRKKNVATQSDISRHHIKGVLPVQVFESGMRHSLQILSTEYGLGSLTYCSWVPLRNGTFCFNIAGRCPIHQKEHSGSHSTWQIHQHPTSDKAWIKCWSASKSRQFPMLPLF